MKISLTAQDAAEILENAEMKELTFHEAAEMISRAVNARARVDVCGGLLTSSNEGREEETALILTRGNKALAFLEWPGTRLYFDQEFSFYLDRPHREPPLAMLIKGPGGSVVLELSGVPV